MSETEKEFVVDVTLVRPKASLLNLNNRRVSIVGDTIRIVGVSQVHTYNISSFVPKKVKIPEYTGGLAMAALHFDRTKPDNAALVSLKFVAKPENHGMLTYFVETYNKLIEANKDVMKNNTTKVKNVETKNVERDSYNMHYHDKLQPYSIINKQSCERTERKLVQAELDKEQRTGQKSSLLSFTKPSTVQRLTEERPSHPPKSMVEASDPFHGRENRKPIVKPNGPCSSALSTTPKRNGFNTSRDLSLRNTPANRGPVKRRFQEDEPEFSFYASSRNVYPQNNLSRALSPKPKFRDPPSCPDSPIDVYRTRKLENTGNSCYFNATMQALSACSSLVLSCWRLRRLDEDEDTRREYFGFLNETKFKVLQGFLKMIITLGIPNDDQGFAVLPDFDPPRRGLFPQFTGEQLRNIRLAVGRVNKDFNNSEQQDAHEYLVTILGIIDDLMEVIAKRDNVDLNSECETKYEASISSLNPASHFKMKVETVYECQKCGTQTFKTELRSDLCLIINEETNVKGLLPAFVKWSALEKTCSDCKHTVASSCERIVDFPRCLVVNLKRYERVGDSYQKKSCSVKPSFHLNARKLGMIEELDVHPELEKTFHGDEQNTLKVFDDNSLTPGKLLGGASFGAGSVDDEVIVECEDSNPEFEFKCLSDAVQLQEVFDKMRIKLTPRQFELNVERLQALPQTKFHKNDPPKDFENDIDGDGNCFYRAVSWCLTGTQTYHASIRECVSEFVRDNSGLLSSYFDDDKETREAVKTIKKDGNWASATDIIALSTCFNIEIYTYLETGWTKYCPREHPSFYQAFEKRNGAIYLQNVGWHYEPVLSISTDSPSRYPVRRGRKRNQSEDEQRDDDNDEFPKKRAPVTRPQPPRTCKQSSDGKKTGPNVSAYSQDPGSIKYMLASVICHEGVSPDKGHYVAYTKGAYDSLWTFCSDRTVRLVDEDEVTEKVSDTGYVLFYTRVYK